MSSERLVYEIDLFQGNRRFVDRIAVPQEPIGAIKFACNVGTDIIVKILCSGEVPKDPLFDAANEMEARVAHFLPRLGVASIITDTNRSIIIDIRNNIERLEPTGDTDSEDDDPFGCPFRSGDVEEDLLGGEEDVTGVGLSQFF